MLAALLLAGMLLLIGAGVRNGRGFSGRIADLIGRTSRSRAIYGWAAGTAVTFGWTSVMALLLLGRLEAIVAMPVELRMTAWRIGLPGAADASDLLWLGGCLVLGGVLGIGLLIALRRFGGRPVGLRYRSPAAVREAGDWQAATVLALAAGIAEELFFRLTLPLLVAIVIGSGVAGLIVGLVAFAAMHRHQGWVGIVATGCVGAALTALYLATGQLWLAMLVHVAIDLNALILRPMMFPGRG